MVWVPASADLETDSRTTVYLELNLHSSSTAAVMNSHRLGGFYSEMYSLTGLTSESKTRWPQGGCFLSVLREGSEQAALRGWQTATLPVFTRPSLCVCVPVACPLLIRTPVTL